MTLYVRVGDVPRKRHTWHRGRPGLAAHRGADGRGGLPRRLVPALPPSLPERHHQRRTGNGAPVAAFGRRPTPALAHPGPRLAPGGDLVTGRHVLFGNTDVTVCWARADRPSEIYRNAAGDELVYVQSGRPTFESVFGRIAAGPGDYVVVPASTTHRWVVPRAKRWKRWWSKRPATSRSPTAT